MKNLFLSLAVVLSLFSANAEDDPKVKLVPIYQNLEIERPIAVMIPPDGSKRRFLVEQTGKIKILPSDESAGKSKLFMDMTSAMSVEKDFEEGLLGLAFHPDYEKNGKFYLSFSRQGPKRLVVSEFTVSKSDSDQGDSGSERVLLEVQQPEWNHNSGNILFDPKDGKLFIVVGEGGFKNGVFMMAQKLTLWNGKVLRIDVDSRTGKLPYGIPQDNPFIDNPIACPEIWATGFRNPWGSSIDAETGNFYLADVGQDLWEEIDLVEKGGNYGWEFREGKQEYAFRKAYMELLKGKPDAPKDAKFLDPIHQYSHADGLSITGGFVYRGKKVSELAGHYLYGDWRMAKIWALRYDQGKVTENHLLHQPEDPKKPLVQPTGFYPDENGEPLVLGWKGKIFRIVGE